MAHRKTLHIPTQEHSCMVNVTSQINHAVSKSGIQDGSCYLFTPHTTAGVTINEQADPSVVRDIVATLETMVPWNGDYQHAEGNSAAHIKSSLFGPALMLMVAHGQLVLGTWQGVFFCEFDGPRERKLELKIVADD